MSGASPTPILATTWIDVAISRGRRRPMASLHGPIISWLCGTSARPGPAGTPVCPQSGSVSGVITSASVLASPTTQQLPAGDLAKVIRLLRNGTGYANIHTANSPGGEIRGQIF